MKIVINTRLLLKDRLEGIGWFTFETLKRITRLKQEHEFIFLFDRPHHPHFVFSENVRAVELFPQSRHPLLWYLWFEYSVPQLLRKEKPDLFLSPDGYLSLKTKVRTNLVMHDIAFEESPFGLSKMAYQYLKYYSPRFAKRADRIATVSEFSKQDIIDKYKIPEDKIDVVYNGSNDIYEPVSESGKMVTRRFYSQDKEYFIFVGAIQPRKNLRNLFKAFDAFKETDTKGIKLMIVGRKAWGTNEIYETFESMKHKEDVIFTGRLSSIELKNLFGAALALTYIPFFEGFGIPVIEAQNCGCPVITSDVTSLPEVAGNAAIFVNPNSVDSIKNAMVKIANDKEERKRLEEAGYLNAKRFSWDMTSERLWNSMVKTISC